MSAIKAKQAFGIGAWRWQAGDAVGRFTGYDVAFFIDACAVDGEALFYAFPPVHSRHRTDDNAAVFDTPVRYRYLFFIPAHTFDNEIRLRGKAKPRRPRLLL